MFEVPLSKFTGLKGSAASRSPLSSYSNSPSESTGAKHEDAERRSKAPSTFTFPNTGSSSLLAKIALDFYNKENASNYHLVEALLSNIMVLSDATWFHCNFKAKTNVDGDSYPELFFAEIIADTMTVTICHILEGSKTTVGCTVCRKIIHPAHGYFRGHSNPKLNVIHSKAKRKRHPESPKPYGEELSQKHLKLAKIAVEYYNKENGANYEVIDALACNPFFSYGIWYHINFTAKPPNGDMSPKLFFAEILRFNKDNPAIEWTFYACLILEGKTTDGCNFCRDTCPRIIHPIHGFSQGIHKSKRIGLEPTIHCKLPENEKCAIRAEIALDYYNKENGTDYEFVENYGSNCFSSDGTLRNCNSVSNQDIDRTWYHCSFTAWRDVDGKYTSRIFFAELFGDSSSPYSDMMENLTVTACVDLKDCETTTGCAVCSGVKHPTHGFLEGVRKPVPEFYSPTSPYPPAYYSPNAPSYPSSCIPYPHPVDAPYPGRSRSKLAVEYYNQKNGTEYELVDALVSNGLVSDGTWLHFNFTARARNGDSYHKKHFFFAEMFGVLKYSCVEFTWKVTACVILEEGETSAGCCLCPDSEVIHPTLGFLKGLHKCVV